MWAAADAGQAEEEELLPHPLAFLCPLSHTLMQEPVTAEDGQDYDRAAITEWVVYCRGTVHSPVTNAPMGSTLRPNLGLRKAIEEYCGWRPAALGRLKEQRTLKEAAEQMRARLMLLENELAETRLRLASAESLSRVQAELILSLGLQVPSIEPGNGEARDLDREASEDASPCNSSEEAPWADMSLLRELCEYVELPRGGRDGDTEPERTPVPQFPPMFSRFAGQGRNAERDPGLTPLPR